MAESLSHDYLYRVPVPIGTVAADWLSGNKTEATADIGLRDWYSDIIADVQRMPESLSLTIKEHAMSVISTNRKAAA